MDWIIITIYFLSFLGTVSVIPLGFYLIKVFLSISQGEQPEERHIKRASICFAFEWAIIVGLIAGGLFLETSLILSFLSLVVAVGSSWLVKMLFREFLNWQVNKVLNTYHR